MIVQIAKGSLCLDKSSSREKETLRYLGMLFIAAAVLSIIRSVEC